MKYLLFVLFWISCISSVWAQDIGPVAPGSVQSEGSTHRSSTSVDLPYKVQPKKIPKKKKTVSVAPKPPKEKKPDIKEILKNMPYIPSLWTDIKGADDPQIPNT